MTERPDTDGVGAGFPADLAAVLADEPTSWTRHRASRLASAYAGLVVLGVAVGAVFWSFADEWDEIAGAGADGWAVVLLPMVLVVGFGLATIQAFTWRATVDDRGVVTAGGALRRRHVDLTRLAEVTLRPAAGKRDMTDTVRLIVRDTAGATVVLDPEADPASWRAWHAIAWYATEQGLPLGIAARLVMARSDAPSLRALLELPSQPVTGALEARRCPRRTWASLHLSGWFGFVLVYAMTLGDPPSAWPWWRSATAVLAVLFVARFLWVLLIGSRRTIRVDDAGVLHLARRSVDLADVRALRQSTLAETDGPFLACLADVEYQQRLEPLDGGKGTGAAWLVDSTDVPIDVAYADEWEPPAALASRLLHAVDEHGIEVSEHVRYDLRAAAGQVPLSEHLDTVERTTGTRPRPERHNAAG